MCVVHYLQHREFVSQAEAVVHAFYDNYLSTGSVSLLSLSVVSSYHPLCDLNKNTSEYEPKNKAGHMSVPRGKLRNHTSVLVTTHQPPPVFSCVNPAHSGRIYCSLP